MPAQPCGPRVAARTGHKLFIGRSAPRADDFFRPGRPTLSNVPAPRYPMASACYNAAMRVIAGTHRGRLLKGPRGRDTRPITDRVKENLFNILAGRVDEAVVADCFCGTGSLGIEALSRGAASVAFAEIDGSALRLLRENLEALGLTDRSRVCRHDVLRKGLPGIADCGLRIADLPASGPDPESGAPGGVPGSEVHALSCDYSLVFLDPPYAISETAAERLWFKLCEAAAAGTVDPDATIVWRHDARVAVEPPPEAAALWTVADRRRYGSQALTFIRPVTAGMTNHECGMSNQ